MLYYLNVSKYLNCVGDTLARKLDRKMQEYNALGKHCEILFYARLQCTDADSQDDETDTNRIVPTGKESTLVPDLLPVVIRQEPTSPVKVSHYNTFYL